MRTSIAKWTGSLGWTLASDVSERLISLPEPSTDLVLVSVDVAPLAEIAMLCNKLSVLGILHPVLDGFGRVVFLGDLRVNDALDRAWRYEQVGLGGVVLTSFVLVLLAVVLGAVHVLLLLIVLLLLLLILEFLLVSVRIHLLILM